MMLPIKKTVAGWHVKKTPGWLIDTNEKRVVMVKQKGHAAACRQPVDCI
jgi:hypothetical protein